MEYNGIHSVETASAKAGFSTATGYRIKQNPMLPSQQQAVRGRRRPDPLAGIFDEEVVPMLEAEPGLRPVGIFEELRRRHADQGPNVRRTLERRVRDWKVEHGPEKEAMFRQRHDHAARDDCCRSGPRSRRPAQRPHRPATGRDR